MLICFIKFVEKNGQVRREKVNVFIKRSATGCTFRKTVYLKNIQKIDKLDGRKAPVKIFMPWKNLYFSGQVGSNSGRVTTNKTLLLFSLFLFLKKFQNLGIKSTSENSPGFYCLPWVVVSAWLVVCRKQEKSLKP